MTSTGYEISDEGSFFRSVPSPLFQLLDNTLNLNRVQSTTHQVPSSRALLILLLLPYVLLRPVLLYTRIAVQTVPGAARAQRRKDGSAPVVNVQSSPQFMLRVQVTLVRVLPFSFLLYF